MMREGRGTQFDPLVLDVFLDSIGEVLGDQGGRRGGSQRRSRPTIPRLATPGPSGCAAREPASTRPRPTSPSRSSRPRPRKPVDSCSPEPTTARRSTPRSRASTISRAPTCSRASTCGARPALVPLPEAATPRCVTASHSTRVCMGRAVRTGEVQFVADSSSDPDFIAAEQGLRSEITVPFDGGLGALNIETRRRRARRGVRPRGRAAGEDPCRPVWSRCGRSSASTSRPSRGSLSTRAPCAESTRSPSSRPVRSAGSSTSSPPSSASAGAAPATSSRASGADPSRARAARPGRPRASSQASSSRQAPRSALSISLGPGLGGLRPEPALAGLAPARGRRQPDRGARRPDRRAAELRPRVDRVGDALCAARSCADRRRAGTAARAARGRDRRADRTPQPQRVRAALPRGARASRARRQAARRRHHRLRRPEGDQRQGRSPARRPGTADRRALSQGEQASRGRRRAVRRRRVRSAAPGDRRRRRTRRGGALASGVSSSRCSRTSCS